MREKIETFASTALELLRPNGEASAYFAAEIAWLEQRLGIWQRQEWRVALIGVTSSGKSTLVNALLDDQLLPVRVRPTSNSLVICRGGEQPCAIVHYQDGRPETLWGAEVAPRLEILTDERTNPENQFAVKEIELFWPGFRLPDDVALVDTPGLDAYQLESHEKLTMQFLLPTVDLVCFLTTAKANADARIAQYLDIVGDHGKPLVLVQNMIDSIKPKIGLGGTVERSSDEVAADHLRRLRRLVEGTNLDPTAIPILQVSAQHAVNGKLDRSNIQQLVRVVTDTLASLRPRLFKGRLQQLHKELCTVVMREQVPRNVALSEGELEREECEIDVRKAEVDALLAGFSSQLSSRKSAAQASGTALRQELERLNPDDVTAARALAGRVEVWHDEGPRILGQAVLEFQTKVRGTGAKLNLGTEDLRIEAPQAPQRAVLEVPVEERTETRTVKKSGIFNKFRRAIGCGGDEEVIYTFESVILASFQRKFKDLVENEIAWLEAGVTTLNGHAKKLCDPLYQELKRQKDSVRARRDHQLAAQHRQTIVLELGQLVLAVKECIASLPQEGTGAEWAEPAATESEVELQVPPYSLDLVRLSHRISSRRYLMLRDALLHRVGGGNFNALIWGFDADSVERFISRFWFDHVCGKPGPGRSLEILDAGSRRVAVALDLADGDADLVGAASGMVGVDTIVFLLVDLEQPGSTKNRLQSSGILPLLKGVGGLVLVVQALAGLENAGTVAAGVVELREMAATFGLTVDGVLVNDDKDIASVLIDRLFREGDRLRTLDDELSWGSDLAWGDGGYVGGILRDWRQELTASEGMYA